MDSIDNKKKILTLFILLFPSILISLIPAEIGPTVWTPITIKALIVFYQFVVIKNFVDTHYGD